MTAGFALDTNVYIDALRDRSELGELKTFLSRYGARVWLSGIVAMELGAGALTADQARAVESFVSRTRVAIASSTSPSRPAVRQAACSRRSRDGSAFA